MKRSSNPGSIVRASTLACCSIFTLVGCNVLNSFSNTDKIDYKSASKISTLEIPPDLTQLPKEERFNVPGNRTTVSASSLTAREPAKPTNAGASGVLPEYKTAKIERLGNQRWLTVAIPPEKAYPIIRDFWGDFGLGLKVDSPGTGIMETEWAENRANIPKDGVRAIIGKVFDGLYDSGTRDKYRVRIERRPDGGSDIYLTHRGMIETPVDKFNGTTRWEWRPSDPELEAEFTRRLLVRFGYEETAAKADVAQPSNTSKESSPSTQSASTLARLVQVNGVSQLEVNENFERAWRRVGLSLDRVGFTVEDRDRTQGLYYVRYAEVGPDGKPEEPGFLSKLFSSGSKPAATTQYRVLVKAEGDKSRVSVSAGDSTATAATANKILSLIAEDLK